MSAIFILVVFACLSYTDVEASVSQCYSCDHVCEDPFEIQHCPRGTPYLFRCLSVRVKIDGEVLESKGCVVASVAESDCAVLDYGMRSSCTLCDTDLCNSAATYSVSVFLVSGLFVLLAKII